MNPIDIRSDIFTISRLFNDFYDVPAYQRDYVWQDDHIEQLLDDIKLAVDEKRPNYFLGTIVVSRAQSDRFYDLIDGQQRLTTIILIFCAFKHYMQTRQKVPFAAIDDVLFGNMSITDIKMRLRVYPQYTESRELLEFLASDNGIDVNNILLKSMFDEEAISVFANLLRAYRTITFWLQETYPNYDDFREYVVYFIRNVMFIRIEAINVNEAMRLFETINERGVRLDPVDLLKNMLFMHASEKEFAELRDNWNNMVRIVQHGRVKASAIQFIRYVVISEYLGEGDGLTREHELYAWFNHNQLRTEHQQNPKKFVRLLHVRAQQFINLRNGYTTNKKECDGSNNIKNLSSSIKQHIPCLLAAQHMSDHMQIQLAQVLEETLYVLVITSSQLNLIERRLTTITEKIRNMRAPDDVNALRGYMHDYILDSLRGEFVNRMRTFSPSRVKASYMRYTLGRLTRHMMGGDEPIEYYIKGLDVCALLPLDPPKELSETEKQYYLSAAHSIGNFVLIEKKLAKDVMTNALASWQAMRSSNSPYILRLQRPMSGSDLMHPVPQYWDVESVLQRRDFLIDTAKHIWNMN
jgi:hypothetical protein